MPTKNMKPMVAAQLPTIKILLLSLVVISFLCSSEGRAQIVYETEFFGDVKIYEVTNSIMADIIVFKAPDSIYPGIDKNSGIWYFSDNQSAANIIVSSVSNSVQSDLKVFYTNNPILAGWKNEDKKKWFVSILKISEQQETDSLNSDHIEFRNLPDIEYEFENP